MGVSSKVQTLELGVATRKAVRALLSESTAARLLRVGATHADPVWIFSNGKCHLDDATIVPKSRRLPNSTLNLAQSLEHATPHAAGTRCAPARSAPGPGRVVRCARRAAVLFVSRSTGCAGAHRRSSGGEGEPCVSVAGRQAFCVSLPVRSGVSNGVSGRQTQARRESPDVQHNNRADSCSSRPTH